MSITAFSTVPIDQPETESEALDWIWHGYLAPGNITLLTSTWKCGKTTLVTGLLRRLKTDGDFLGQPCRFAKVLVISEESSTQWSERTRTRPIGSHTNLIARTFAKRPTLEDWEQLIDHSVEQRQSGNLDLFVIDPLGSVLPGGTENVASRMIDVLRALHRLTSTGAAVLLLHHPRKEQARVGDTARGSGALLGFVDVILEIHRCGRSHEERRRRLVGLSRYAETPAQVFYEWNPETDAYTDPGDLMLRGFRENWPTLAWVLDHQDRELTRWEILAAWPGLETERPSAMTLYNWLSQAMAEKLIYQIGAGTKGSPYRYRMPTEVDRLMDAWDK